MINSGISKSLKHTKKFAKICNPNKSLPPEVKELEAAEPFKAQTSSCRQLMKK
jgi:hypothetical protein